MSKCLSIHVVNTTKIGAQGIRSIETETYLHCNSTTQDFYSLLPTIFYII